MIKELEDTILIQGILAENQVTQEILYKKYRKIVKDFILSNTNFAGYKDIPQLWYNKIVTAISQLDISTKNAIDYIDNFNVFKSQWDRNYYIMDNTSVDGYNASMELPAYFGSKLIKLPEIIILDTWDNNTVKYSTINNEYIIEYNLTRQLISIFKNNVDFVINWTDLAVTDKIINNYINDTIINYYNISQSFINTEMWVKPYNGNVIAFETDAEFIQDKAANITSMLNFVNNEFIYKITVNNYPQKTYLFKFNLFEK